MWQQLDKPDVCVHRLEFKHVFYYRLQFLADLNGLKSFEVIVFLKMNFKWANYHNVFATTTQKKE